MDIIKQFTEAIPKAIKTYGAFNVVLSFFLGLITIIVVSVGLNIESYKNMLSRSEREHQESLDMRTINSEKIQLDLDILANRYHLDRIFVSEFHNGGSNLAGLSFKFFKETYETTTVDTLISVLDHKIDTPSSFYKYISRLKREKLVYGLICDLAVNDRNLRIAASESNVKYFIGYFMEDESDIGFIGIELTRIPEPEELVKILVDVQMRGQNICNLLNYTSNKNTNH